MYREPAYAGVVRFFCPVNDTELSVMARRYTEALVLMGFKIRLLSTRMGELGRLGKEWVPLRGLFLTPIESSFVNVVCGDPFDWHRLYTANVKNVLVASSPPAPDLQVPGLKVAITDQRGVAVGSVQGDAAIAAQVAARYDVIVVPTEEISLQWKAIGLSAVVVPMEVGAHAAALRSAISDHGQPPQPPPAPPA